MNSSRSVAAFRWCVSFAALAGIVLVYSRWLHVNNTTVALTLLLLILIIAGRWSLRYAVAISLAATFAYNLFFLPPIGTLVIADAQNWLALLVFLATAVIGSRLSQRARDEAEEAKARQHEMAVSLQLGQELLQLDNVSNVIETLPMLIARVTGAHTVSLYLLEGDRLAQHGLVQTFPTELPHLRQLALSQRDLDRSQPDEARMPLFAGVRPRGLLQIRGTALSSASLQSIAGLASSALDRAHALEEVARVEANKESERMRTLIIDAITHELRTPLTSIKGAASAMLANEGMDMASRQELLHIVDEESDRLNLLVTRATEMAQLDAQQVRMDFAPTEVNTLLEAARDEVGPACAQHTLDISAEHLPAVRADSELIGKVLGNLIENAAKYSDAGTPIFLSARHEGETVAISVADRGYGIDSSEQSFVFDRFYRAKSSSLTGPGGTGMGLAISKAIVEAHGGTIQLTSQLGQGSVFTFTLPVMQGDPDHLAEHSFSD